MLDPVVRTSIQVCIANRTTDEPISFGTGCMVIYQNRLFFISVAHVTWAEEDKVVYIETNQPPKVENGEKFPPMARIGGIFTLGQFKVKKIENVKSFNDLISSATDEKIFDISFAAVKEPIEIFQPALDFGAIKIEAGYKVGIMLDNASEPDPSEVFAFYGKVKHRIAGRTVHSENTIKHSLKFKYKLNQLVYFEAPEIIKNAKDYQGTSGAPILDSKGRIVALACKIATRTNVIMGFSIIECKKLIDIVLSTGQL